MANIKELFLRRFNHVMPSVYDDAISYPELLYKMVDKTDEIIEQVNTNTEDIEANKLTADDATEGQVLTADGEGGYSWEDSNVSNTQTRYIFPPNWSDTASGSCTLIITPTGKVMMIDSHNESIANTMVEWVQTYTDHLDVFVLSHYHADHYGGMQALIDADLIDTDTDVFLPADTQYVADNYATVRANIISMLGSIYYTTPSVGQTILADGDFTAKTYNCSSSMTYTDYNNQSTIVLCQMGAQKALFTADAYSDSLYDSKGYIGKVELMTMGHHSINAGSSTKMFIALSEFSPDYAVQPSTLTGSTGNMYHNSQQSAILQGIGSEIYPVHTNTQSIEFDANSDNTWVVSGVPVASVSSQRTKVTYYVDASVDTDAIQDGTSTYPFKSVQQAVGACDFYAHADYEILIASGTYGQEHETAGKNLIVIYNGVVTFAPMSAEDTVTLYNGFAILDAHVRIKNMTLMSEASTEGLITARGSRVYLENLTINCSGMSSSGESEGEEDTSADVIGIYAYRQCDILINTCTILNADRGVALNASTCNGMNVTFSNCTKAWSVATASVLFEYNSTYTSVTTQKYVRAGSYEITAEATTSTAGLMSAEDKTNLDLVVADYEAMLALI